MGVISGAYALISVPVGLALRILMIGDVVGRPGRRAVKALLPGLRRDMCLDLVVANGENLAGGFGISRETAVELLGYGVDVITSGNHVWDKKEIIPHMDSDLPLLRPLNYPPGSPGRGHLRKGGATVVNLIGRVFVGTFDCPFRAADAVLEAQEDQASIVIVDLHAEATSEKEAMGWYLDGRVSVVAGTHTHVPTADTRVLPKGTAYVSDLGMVGAVDSVIGSEPKDVLERFLYQTPKRLHIVDKGPLRFNSVLIEVDESTRKATLIERVDREIP